MNIIKKRSELALIIIFAILLISVGISKEQGDRANAVLIQSSDNNETTSIILLTLNFNDTANWYNKAELAELETSLLVPAFNFINNSSGSKMIVEIDEYIQYTAKYNEAYYGADSETLADINLLELYDEIKDNLEKDKLLVVIHPGISQTLRLGNSTGIYDQYLGKVKGYPDGVIFLSRYSPFSMLVHEIGHFWGLPDLYNQNQIGEYGIMGSGGWYSYNETTKIHGWDGTDPIDFSSWSKIQMGWVDYWNATNVKKSSYNKEDIILVNNFLFQYVNKGLVKPGLVVLSDKYNDVEFIDLLEEGNSQRYRLRDNSVISVRFKNNEITISYTVIENLDFSFGNIIYRISQISLILLIAYLIRRFSELM